MGKQLITGIMFLLFSIVAANSTYAELEPLSGLYMTDEGSMEPKDIFGWNETPFAFMQFDVDDLNTDKPLTVWWKWRHETGPWFFFDWERVNNFSGDTLEIWNSPDSWDLKKQAGGWNVQATWRNPGSGGGMRMTDFSVTPEPLSSSLLVTGCVVMAGWRYRKRKRKL